MSKRNIRADLVRLFFIWFLSKDHFLENILWRRGYKRAYMCISEGFIWHLTYLPPNRDLIRLFMNTGFKTTYWAHRVDIFLRNIHQLSCMGSICKQVSHHSLEKSVSNWIRFCCYNSDKHTGLCPILFKRDLSRAAVHN